MEKIIIPLTFTGLLLISGGFLYMSALRHFKNHPQLILDTRERALSLAEVKLTSVTIQQNVNYSIEYAVETMTTASGWKIHSHSDTTAIWMLAESETDGNGQAITKPVLPNGHNFNWGTLNFR